MESLKKVLLYNYQTFLPTHGGPIKEPRKFVKALIAHRKMRENQILRELLNGNMTVKEMVFKFYKTIDKRLLPAAEKSLLATLLSLKKRRKVVNLENKNIRWKLTKK